MKVSERLRYESYSWYLCAQSTTMVLFACIRFHSQLYMPIYMNYHKGRERKKHVAAAAAEKEGG